MTRAGPVERVRARLLPVVGPETIRQLPDGYQRLGRVLLLRLPEALRPRFPAIGDAYRSELNVGSVLRWRGTVEGDHRVPQLELVAGEDTETEVLENGIRYRFDAARIMFSAGNKRERARAGTLVRPGEVVADLFAGIGYFTLPAAVHGRAGKVYACELNPVSASYLEENVRRNRVADRVEVLVGDNRDAPIPAGSVDRVFLGLLPSSLGYIGRGLNLLRPSGGTLHVHLVAGSHGGVAEAGGAVRAAVDRQGGRVEELEGREVKPYGPGRLHAVVDVRVSPRRTGA